MNKIERQLEVLQMIIEDMETDVKEADGKPFTGETLAELHGNLCAIIQTLAIIMKKHIEDSTNE